MSRTDKTRPWWVRMADAPMVTCIPVHDHRFGPCSLPDEITADNACLGFHPDRCYWGTSYDRIGRVDGATQPDRCVDEDWFGPLGVAGVGWACSVIGSVTA